VQAIKLLRDAKQRIHLRMVNSLYPSPISKQEMARTMDYIARHNLESQVTLVTSFLDDHASLRLLSEADLIVNPYQHTNESASGSVRYALSTGKPVAVTPLSIFDDLGDAVFRLPGITPEDLAEGIANTIREIENDTPAAHTVARATSMLIDAHDFAVLGTRLAGMLRALMRQGRANTA
jgi:glycosyltransferase involved in cell wall biosynthesis